MKRLKWFLIPSMMVILVAIVGPVAAGVKWSGIDPIFELNGQRVNVRIDYPSEFDCSIDGAIPVRVTIPAGTDVKFFTESTANLSGCDQETITTISESNDITGQFQVRAKVSSEEQFKLKVRVYVSGLPTKNFNGDSNEWVGGRVKFHPASDN